MTRPQKRRQNLFRGCLADRAGHCAYQAAGPSLAPDFTGTRSQLLQSDERVVHRKKPASNFFGVIVQPLPRYQTCRGTALQSGGHEDMTVVLWSTYSHEQLTGPQGTRINGDATDHN